MLSLGDLFKLLLFLVVLGLGGQQWLKSLEREMGTLALKAYKRGPISFSDFHRELTGTKSRN